MKIGIVCSPTYGGSGVVATELGRFLALRGHEVHFISVAMPFRLETAPLQNIMFHEVQTLDYPVLPGDLSGIAIAGRTAQVAADYGLDLIHAHYAVPHAISSWLAREVLRVRKLRVVTTLHGTDITLVGKAPSFFPIARFAIETSDAVTTVSNWLRTETEREFGLRRPIDVIPNFVDDEKFQRRPVCPIKKHYAPNGEKILLHVSNFRPVKRVQDVVAVFARVRAAVPSKLLFIGDGPERDTAARLARELGVAAHTHFLGKQEKIENFFSCADVMLFPSEYESFGLAALEAMASENVVIASNGGGLPEVIRHGIDGFLAPVGDVETMARHAIDILRDPDRAREMGRVARRHAVERFHIAKVVPRYEAVYERVLDRDPVGMSGWAPDI
jgi:N-acetyl-alpha-D-glucosaminyl L-malate synthase BshA